MTDDAGAKFTCASLIAIGPETGPDRLAATANVVPIGRSVCGASLRSGVDCVQDNDEVGVNVEVLAEDGIVFVGLHLVSFGE